MADEKKRITAYPTASSLGDDDYVMIDNGGANGTKKYLAKNLGGSGLTSLWTGEFGYNHTTSIVFDSNLFKADKIYLFKYASDANDGYKTGFALGIDILSGTKFTVGATWGQTSNTWTQITYNSSTYTMTYVNGNGIIVEILEY